jgi:hypothetical protein
LLLVVPHSHPQDWVMLAPAAAIMLRSQTSTAGIAVTTLLLIGASLGMDHWSQLRDRAYVIYWPTLAGFSLLVWVYFVSEARYALARGASYDDRLESAQALSTGAQLGATQSP